MQIASPRSACSRRTLQNCSMPVHNSCFRTPVSSMQLGAPRSPSQSVGILAGFLSAFSSSASADTIRHCCAWLNASLTRLYALPCCKSTRREAALLRCAALVACCCCTRGNVSCLLPCTYELWMTSGRMLMAPKPSGIKPNSVIARAQDFAKFLCNTRCCSASSRFNLPTGAARGVIPEPDSTLPDAALRPGRALQDPPGSHALSPSPEERKEPYATHPTPAGTQRGVR